MQINLKQNITRVLLVLILVISINSISSLVEASKNREYNIKYDSKVINSKISIIDKHNKRKEKKPLLTLEKYTFPSDNYKISFPKKRYLLLSTEDSAKFYYNDFMITTDIITSSVNLTTNNKYKNIEKLKKMAIDLQEYSGYKVVTSSYIKDSSVIPEYYYFELKNKNDIITFRNLTIMGLIPLKNKTGNNDYLMISLNANARNILQAQKIFNKIFSTVKLNKKKLSKYKVSKKNLTNHSLKYKINIPKNFYAHTKNSDQLIILKSISGLIKKNTDEISIRKFTSDKYSEFSKSNNKDFKLKANMFIKNLTKYSKNQKIETYSTKIIDNKNSIIFKTIESNSKNYITTLNCYIFYNNFGYVIKYTSNNLNQNFINVNEIYKCFSSFKNNFNK